jgi:transcriptional regulator with XRE-family HTH domain
VFPEGIHTVPRYFSGQQLRETRIAKGLKPEALALRVDRSVYSIHEYERGRAFPSVPVLGALAMVLGCSIDSLFTTDEALSRAA